MTPARAAHYCPYFKCWHHLHDPPLFLFFPHLPHLQSFQAWNPRAQSFIYLLHSTFSARLPRKHTSRFALGQECSHAPGVTPNRFVYWHLVWLTTKCALNTSMSFVAESVSRSKAPEQRRASCARKRLPPCVSWGLIFRGIARRTSMYSKANSSIT